jgi:hypothetical protein
MRVLPALAMTNARLTSSTAPEPGIGEVAWTSGGTFALGDTAILGSPASTVTISIASPGLVTWTANGLPDGTPVVLTTTGALPTGLVAGTIYYVVNRATDSFWLSATPDGGPIVTTGAQSGTHTATAQLHRKYESQIAGNTGNPPAIDDGAKWIDVGPTNRWAAHDLDRNTGTITASPQVHVITPGVRIDSIGLVGLVADAVTIDLKVGGVSLTGYPVTISLSTRGTTTWKQYFFGKFTFKKAAALFDLPPVTGAALTITLTRSAGNVTTGGILLGTSVYLGRTLHDAEAGRLNFSTIDRDIGGEAVLIRRRNKPKTTQQVRCSKSAVNGILRTLDDLNAVPALWSGLDDAESGYFEALLILGIYKEATVNMDQPDEALLTLSLEEV